MLLDVFVSKWIMNPRLRRRGRETGVGSHGDFSLSLIRAVPRNSPSSPTDVEAAASLLTSISSVRNSYRGGYGDLRYSGYLLSSANISLRGPGSLCPPLRIHATYER